MFAPETFDHTAVPAHWLRCGQCVGKPFWLHPFPFDDLPIEADERRWVVEMAQWSDRAVAVDAGSALIPPGRDSPNAMLFGGSLDVPQASLITVFFFRPARALVQFHALFAKHGSQRRAGRGHVYGNSMLIFGTVHQHRSVKFAIFMCTNQRAIDNKSHGGNEHGNQGVHFGRHKTTSWRRGSDYHASSPINRWL